MLICCEFCINILRLLHFKAVSPFYDLLEGDLFTKTWKLVRKDWTSAVRAVSPDVTQKKELKLDS